MTDDVSELRTALLDLSAGLERVAATLHMAGSPGDTGQALVALAPVFVRVGETMQRMYA